MLIALYEHLGQAHAAISELRQVGLTQAHIGCAFKASDIRVPTPLSRLAQRIFQSSKFQNEDRLRNAAHLCRVILPEPLQGRAVQVLTRGGALVSVHDQKPATTEGLLRILQAHERTGIVFVPQFEPKPAREIATASRALATSVKLMGALSFASTTTDSPANVTPRTVRSASYQVLLGCLLLLHVATYLN
jgi:hypothetical protein